MCRPRHIYQHIGTIFSVNIYMYVYTHTYLITWHPFFSRPRPEYILFNSYPLITQWSLPYNLIDLSTLQKTMSLAQWFRQQNRMHERRQNMKGLHLSLHIKRKGVKQRPKVFLKNNKCEIFIIQYSFKIFK